MPKDEVSVSAIWPVLEKLWKPVAFIIAITATALSLYYGLESSISQAHVKIRDTREEVAEIRQDVEAVKEADAEQRGQIKEIKDGIKTIIQIIRQDRRRR